MPQWAHLRLLEESFKTEGHLTRNRPEDDKGRTEQVYRFESRLWDLEADALRAMHGEEADPNDSVAVFRAQSSIRGSFHHSLIQERQAPKTDNVE